MTNIPLGNHDLICPLHRCSMDRVCHKCPWWTQLRGINPNTGAEVDDWQCAMSLLPLLLIDVAKESRQGAAATESFRNEMVRANQQVANVIAARSVLAIEG